MYAEISFEKTNKNFRNSFFRKMAEYGKTGRQLLLKSAEGSFRADLDCVDRKKKKITLLFPKKDHSCFVKWLRAISMITSISSLNVVVIYRDQGIFCRDSLSVTRGKVSVRQMRQIAVDG